MSNTISRSDLLEAVSEMDMDELSDLREVIQVRQEHIAREKKRSLAVGDKVKVTDLRKTNEWAGEHVGVIDKINRKTARVLIPHPIHGHDSPWKIHLQHLEKVED